MATYYVNRDAQANGDHEVHKKGCSKEPSNRIDLGDHANCWSAVDAAKKYYSQVNGCKICSNECHTQ